jgi:DnaJ-class molecular chaperone
MNTATPTKPTYRTETCPRCKGRGEYRAYGMCYGCQGRGTVQIENGRRPLTTDEQAAYDEYQAGLDAREARAAARAARKAARS